MSIDENLEHLRAAASRGDLAAKTTLGKRLIAEGASLKSFQDGQTLLTQALGAHKNKR